MTGLLQGGAERSKVVDINYFLDISPRESDPAHFPQLQGATWHSLKSLQVIECFLCLVYNPVGAYQHAGGIVIQRIGEFIFRLAVGQSDAQTNGDQHGKDKYASHQTDQMSGFHAVVSFLVHPSWALSSLPEEKDFIAK